MSEVRDRLLPDADARRHAVDPTQNVVLEASAGTGKTRVLVDRYVNLLLKGVDPEHILAITFTRKAAAEMRGRILDKLREAGRTLQIDAARWRELRDRLGDVQISTIDAFCLALLREFPLEADVDPGFDLADETEVPRLIDEALDTALRICRSRASGDDDVALLFAQLGERRLRAGLAALLDRRLVAPDVLRRFLQDGPRDLTIEGLCRSAADRFGAALAGVPGGLDAFAGDGPIRRAEFTLLASDMRRLAARDFATDTAEGRAALRAAIDRLRAYFLTQNNRPRGSQFRGTPFAAADCTSDSAWRRHRATAAALAPVIADAVAAFRRDLNVVLSRAVRSVYAIALAQYERTLAAHAVLDFPGVLARALDLLRQMDEFAKSRYRLEARYHHVLLDEFQDTSRAQWELVAQLVRSWGEGLGASADALPPSIFVVGDRKQSIYGFRDADVGMLNEAAAFIERLRPEGQPRRAISVSFRSAPEVLAFVNDLFAEIVAASPDTASRRDAFRYDHRDRFPVDPQAPETGTGVVCSSCSTDGAGTANDSRPRFSVGVVVGDSVAETADAVADEIVRLIASGTLVRDKATGLRRAVSAGDIAVLFRSRDSHRDFERAIGDRGVATYVYKGLGFFDADEIQDAVALLRFLADPASEIRAAAFMRSRIVRLSDEAIARLAPHLSAALVAADRPRAWDRLSSEDQAVLERVRDALPQWLAAVDRVAPAQLLETVLRDTAYDLELRGPRRLQARENLKKLRALVRRVHNRGYATLARIADHLDRLAVGDESNATIDAADAVSLMTVHAAKGLEFPVVFVVNLTRGTGGFRPPIRVALAGDGEPSVAIADYQSEADEDAQAREREETKRLLYVALTRARDLLYLSTPLADGTCRPGSGSLGEVLPPSAIRLFEEAGIAPGAARRIAWTAPGGAHEVLAIRGGIGAALPPSPSVPSLAFEAVPDLLGPVEPDELVDPTPAARDGR